MRLVEVRGIEKGYPFYGAPELAGGVAYSHALVENHGVLVQPELLTVLNVKVGDELKLAGQAFTIRGVITRDRVQRSGGIAFGPRVYVDLADLRQTPLLGFGSRASYQLFLRVDEASINRLTQQLRREFRRDVVNVRSWRGLEDRLGENLTTAENYLSLVGFAIVVLGGIGVWSVTRVVVLQKMKSVAILKCLGATSGRVLATYVLQVLWLAAGGSVLGLALAMVAVAMIPHRLLEPVGVTSIGVTPSAAVQGAAVGLLVSLLFALVPLLEVRRVKPLLLLRADTMTTARRRDWQSLARGRRRRHRARARRGVAGELMEGRPVRLRRPCGRRTRAARREPRARVDASGDSPGRRSSRCVMRCSASGGRATRRASS